MGSDVKLLIKNYDDADTKMKQVLDAGSDLRSSEIMLLDKVLDTAFNEIVDAGLDSKQEVLVRVRFLLSVIEKLSENSELAGRITETIMSDVQSLGDDQTENESSVSETDSDPIASNVVPIRI